jgi:hypothetical protein
MFESELSNALERIVKNGHGKFTILSRSPIKNERITVGKLRSIAFHLFLSTSQPSVHISQQHSLSHLPTVPNPSKVPPFPSSFTHPHPATLPSIFFPFPLKSHSIPVLLLSLSSYTYRTISTIHQTELLF